MFKYISEILSQFTKTQRIMALLMVLVAIVIITIAPSLISALESNSDSLKKQIARQNSRIETLENDIDTLNLKLRDQEMKCTDEIYSRETEFVQMLEDLKKDIKSKENSDNAIRRVHAMSKTPSGNTDEMEMNIPPDQYKPVYNTQNSGSQNMKPILNKIEMMQKKMGKNR